jgi:DNA-binding NarL/FixJ family response regulator
LAREFLRRAIVMADLNRNVNVAPIPQTRLLLVDDDRYLTEALAASLEARLFHVRTAHSTRQGLTELALDHFDVAIIDWLMPDGNGAALLDFAKRRLPEMPVVVYSAHEGADAQSVVAKADGFVLKGGGERESSSPDCRHRTPRVLQPAAKTRDGA